MKFLLTFNKLYSFVDIFPLVAQMVSIKIVIDHYYRKLSNLSNSQKFRFAANSTHRAEDSSFVQEEDVISLTKSIVDQKDSLIGWTSSLSKTETFIEHD